MSKSKFLTISAQVFPSVILHYTSVAPRFVRTKEQVDHPGSFQPADPDLLFQRFESRGASNKFSLLFLRQRGGEGSGETDSEPGFEISSYINQSAFVA